MAKMPKGFFQTGGIQRGQLVDIPQGKMSPVPFKRDIPVDTPYTTNIETDSDLGDVYVQTGDDKIYHRIKRPTLIIKSIRAQFLGAANQTLYILSPVTFIEFVNYGDPVDLEGNLLITFNNQAPETTVITAPQSGTSLNILNGAPLIVPPGASRTYNNLYLKRYQALSGAGRTDLMIPIRITSVDDLGVGAQPVYDINIGFQTEPKILVP